jgi:hypothetical protein
MTKIPVTGINRCSSVTLILASNSLTHSPTAILVLVEFDCIQFDYIYPLSGGTTKWIQTMALRFGEGFASALIASRLDI